MHAAVCMRVCSSPRYHVGKTYGGAENDGDDIMQQKRKMPFRHFADCIKQKLITRRWV